MRLLLFLLSFMLSLSSPTPLQSAIGSLGARTPIGSILRTAEWAQLPVELRESAFFSAAVEDARLLSLMKTKLDHAIQLTREQLANGKTALVNRSSFIGDVKDELAKLGYTPEPGKAGGLEDLSSRRRLGLIFDTQIARAQGYAEWLQGQDPDMLDAFPCQELLRKEDREVPRLWRERWVQAGGRLFGGRMIARKNHPVWAKISRFGTPWPPFDFQSGMGVEDVDRAEAEQLGVIPVNAVVEPMTASFTQGLQASVRGLEPRLLNALRTLFGDQVTIADGAVKWTEGMANTRVYHRDALGQFAADGGPLSEKLNIRRGKAAIEAAQRSKRDQPNAMNVRGLGSVDFPWGRPGHKAVIGGKTHTDGYGLSHILDKHGKAALAILPVVLAKGRVTPHETPEKRRVTYGRWLAIVGKTSPHSAWAITNFDNS